MKLNTASGGERKGSESMTSLSQIPKIKISEKVRRNRGVNTSTGNAEVKASKGTEDVM